MKARLLRTAVISELRNKVNDNLERYRHGNFNFLQEDTSLFFEVDQEINLERITQIRCEEDDYREEALNCEHMFHAFLGMTPYIARDERLWFYLTHTDILTYSRARWSIPDDDEKAIRHILTHFFASGKRGIERDNSASRLWWMAFLCSRSEKFTLREALEYFLYKTDVRANVIERPTTSQNALVFSAILEKLQESFHGDKKLYDREIFRNFMVELNVQGGVRLLDSLGKPYLNDILSLITSNH